MKTAELRKVFLDFFKAKDHRLFASDTLIPDDASLLFTSAGMNQFKPYFLGEKADVQRATSCQKCLRTGDLENVGKTAYHHTFFEMLGNFSFGDYFKKAAIEYAWEFLTKELKQYICEKDLWISVYEDDSEAYQIWKNHIGIPEERIVKLGEGSNFWPANAPSQGPNGPCGPCSEIFFDRGKEIGCKDPKCNPDCGCGRFVEIWNLVFTQFNRVGENKLEPLPQNNIDTGMGLERMACVLQGKISNFEIDILAPVVKEVREMLTEESCLKEEAVSVINAIVDHARAATFSIADGVFPSNEGRGYVVRKIIRRALLGSRIFNNKKPFLHRLTKLFVELMQEQYPEIAKKSANISKIIRSEEEKYFSMLEAGKTYAAGIIENLKKTNKNTIEAKDIFFLYDTYGLPLEFIREFAEKEGFKADEAGFESLLAQQQERSRKKSMFEESIFKPGEFDLKAKSEFVGYRDLDISTEVEHIFVAGQAVESIVGSQEAIVILKKTPFYPESGGQLFDKGTIKSKDGKFTVIKVFKINEAIAHQGVISEGKLTKGMVEASVDLKRRKALARAHTATHLLQAALRETLGDHVIQQGSLVDEDKLRFDFTHFSKLSNEELAQVEQRVKDFIKQAKVVEKKELKLSEAKAQGALAFFKDKYKDKVRVVSVSDCSNEFCGGTHVENTKDIEDFAIVSESSISSGIRRIKAVVAGQVSQSDLAQTGNQAKKTVKKSLGENKKADQEKLNQIVSKLEKTISSGSIESIGEVDFILNFESLKLSSSQEQSRVILMLSDRLRQKYPSAFIFIARSVEGKDIFICSIGENLIKRGLSCKKFVSDFKKELSLVGGGNEKSVKGAILNRSDDLLEKVKGAFIKFIKL